MSLLCVVIMLRTMATLFTQFKCICAWVEWVAIIYRHYHWLSLSSYHHNIVNISPTWGYSCCCRFNTIAKFYLIESNSWTSIFIYSRQKKKMRTKEKERERERRDFSVSMVSNYINFNCCDAQLWFCPVRCIINI